MSWPSGISNVTLFVEDLAAARQFYIDVFGLPVAFEDDESTASTSGMSPSTSSRPRRPTS